jgi:hypothetical protein
LLPRCDRAGRAFARIFLRRGFASGLCLAHAGPAVLATAPEIRARSRLMVARLNMVAA